MAVTGRLGLLAALAALLVGVAAPSWLAVGAATLVLLALAGLDVALAGSVRGLALVRDGATDVRLGESADVRLVIGNPGGRRVRGLVRDGWPPSAGATTTRHRLDVPSGERRSIVTTLTPTRRGDRPAARITVRSVGPLGLAARQGSHAVPWRLRVLPPFTSRRHLPAKLSRLRELDGRTTVLVRGQGTEFDSLRGYVDGDDVRSIDWRATARRGELAVRTWRPERDRRVLLVLDTSRTSAGRIGDVPRLDAALDAALLLAALAGRAGDRVDLLAFDRRVRARVRSGSGRSALGPLVQGMAPLEPELVEADMAGLVATVLAEAPRRSLVVLFTALDAAPVQEGLLPVLGRLTARHRVVLASVSDPALQALAADRSDAASAYLAAAAERAGLDRARTAERLVRDGVEVVDAPPQDLASQLADRYLALKAAGRL